MCRATASLLALTAWPIPVALAGEPIPAQSRATRALVWLSDSRLDANASRCSTAMRSSTNQPGIGCACRAAATAAGNRRTAGIPPTGGRGRPAREARRRSTAPPAVSGAAPRASAAVRQPPVAATRRKTGTPSAVKLGKLIRFRKQDVNRLIEKGKRRADTQAGYDLRKLRGKNLVDKAGNSRRYHVPPDAARTITALLVLRDQVLAPVIAGVQAPTRRRKPAHSTATDRHYDKLRTDMRALLKHLGITTRASLAPAA